MFIPEPSINRSIDSKCYVNKCLNLSGGYKMKYQQLLKWHRIVSIVGTTLSGIFLVFIFQLPAMEPSYVQVVHIKDKSTNFTSTSSLLVTTPTRVQ